MDKKKTEFTVNEDVKKTVMNAFKSDSVPKIYANGFLTGHSNSDSYVLLQQNSMPIAVLNLSFTTAKTLHDSLGQLISEIEAKTNNTIMVMGDIAKI